jgi:hypothetical protein
VTLALVLLVLLAGLIHALWNALAKGIARQTPASVVVAGIALPRLF